MTRAVDRWSSGDAASASRAQRGPRVLVVDDSPTGAIATQMRLIQAGFNVELAPDGPQALELLRAARPDALLTDVLMPGMDGFQLCRAIRADPQLGDLPVLLLTVTFGGERDRALAAAAGADDFLVGDLTPKELATRILDAIAGRAGLTAGLHAIEDFDAEHAETLRRRLITKVAELEEAYRILRTEHTASTEVAGRLQAHLAAIVDASDHAIFSTAPSGTIVSWNPGAERLYGLAREAAIGQPVSVLFGPGRAAADAAMFSRAAGGGAAERADSDHVRADGAGVAVHLTVAPMVDPDGSVAGVSAIVADITERRRHEEALAAARAEAERANRAKSDFLSRMSHELRTPLNAILGFAQLLEMDDLDPAQRESVDHVLKGGRHLLALIDEVLDISRIETGSMRLSLEPVEVASALGEVISLMAPIAAERDITVSSDLEGAAELYVHADRQRVRQIVLNLVSNAIKYNRDGGSVTLSAQSAEEPGRLRIVVADTGPGIEAANLIRLFAPFDRLDAEAGEVPGTGLGLALSRGLAEQMGGTLTVTSEVGRGSCFTLELDAASDPVGADRLRQARCAGRQAIGVGVRSVLYVEDNPASVRLVEQLFAAQPDIRVIAAPQGQVGVELAHAHRPDVILLDLHLPDMGGADVLDQLRRDPATAAIPVIVLSADARQRDIARLRAAGAHEVLPKPVDLTELLEVIRDLAPAEGPSA